MKTEIIIIHYSVQNCGDGSAYPQFMTTAKLAEWDQNHMDEGWGESCDGTLEIEVEEGSYIGSPEVVTELGYLVDHWLENNYPDDGWDLLDEFKTDFFPNGVPELTVKMDESSSKHHYFVCHGEAVVAKKFAYNPDNDSCATEEGRAALEEALKVLQSKDTVI